MANDNIKTLYNALKNKYDLGSEADFRKSLTNESNRRTLYNTIKDSYDLGSEQDFNKSLGYNTTPAPAPAQTKKQQTKVGSVAKEVVDEFDRRNNAYMSEKPSEGEKNKYLNMTNNILGQARQSSQKARNIINYSKKKKAINVPTRYKIGENTNVVKTGNQYITESGNVYDKRGAADLEQNQIDEYKERTLKPIETALRDAYAERDSIDQQMRDRMKEIDDENKGVGGFLREFAEASRQPGMLNPLERYQTDEIYRQLESAARKNKATIQTLEDKRDNRMNDFWHSIATTAANGYTFNDGLAEINDAIALMDARKHIDSINTKRQTGEPLTKEEAAAEAVLSSDIVNNEVQGKYAGDYGAWASAGQMVPTSVDFMKDFMLTPGAGGIAKGIARKVSGIGGKYLAKEIGGSAAKEAAKTMARGLLKGTGILLGTHTAGAVISNTARINRTAGAMGANVAGRAAVDENGNIAIQDSMDMLDAFIDAERNQIRETGSEMFGEFIPGLGGIAKKGLEKIGLSKISKALTNVGNKQWYQQYNKLLTAGGYNGIPGEALEEYEGFAFDALTGNAEEAWNQLKDPRTHVDIWLGTAAMSALLGAVPVTLQGAHTARYYKYKHDTNKAERIASYRFADADKWSALRDRIDTTPNEQMTDVVVDIMSDNDLYPQQKTAALNYVRNLTKMRGFNIGQMANVNQQSADNEAANNSYSEGYNADDTQLSDIKNIYDLRKEQVANILGVDVELVDDTIGDPAVFVAELQQLNRNNEIKPILDYVNAKSRYDGMIQRVRDDLDNSIAESNEMIDSRVNRSNGMIQPAVMKTQDKDGNSRQSYIISGSVEMLPDGSDVDHEKSSNSILIRYADTGELEMVSPTSIMSIGEPIDPEQERAEAEANITQSFAQPKADAIDGKVSFAPGDTYTLTDEKGQTAEAQVIANGDGIVDNGDGTVNVTFDGGQTIKAVSKDDIQSMVDNTNRLRVAAQIESENQQQAQPETRQYNLNEELILQNPDGTQFTATVVDTDYNDGTILIEYDTPQGRRVMPYTKEQLDSMIVPENQTEEATIEQQIPDAETAQQDETQQPEQPEQPKVPIDENGNVIYEQLDPDTAWDTLVQEAGDEETAQSIADSMVSDAESNLKKLSGKKLKSGTTAQEKLAEARQNKQAVDDATALLNHWKAIAGTQKRRQQAIEDERKKEAEEAARIKKEEEEKMRAQKEEEERIKREALKGVPDFVEDTPQDARARGYRRVNGEKIDRQQSIPARQGREMQVKFDDKNIPTGHVALIEANQLQPSHINGQRNPLHFIDEAQPKERKDDASVMSARKIAENIRPEEITSSVTAYTGAPTVNTRGEVIQGNNQSAALREMWAGEPEQAAIYKQYLADHAADFGLAPEDVEAMQQPVLVNMLDVPDEDAITLGQFVASDTESGGTERIKPKNIVQKMGDDMRSFAWRLLASPDEEMTFSELVDRNGMDVLKWMQAKNYITPTQYRSAFDSKGNLTGEAKNDLKGVMYQSIFQNGNTHLEEMFGALPAKAQKAILATAYRDYDSPNAERLNAEIQNSISAYYALSQNADFANAKNYKEARLAVEAWKRQYALDDVTGESYLPSDKYSNFALLLATMYKGQTQTFIQNTFNSIFDLVQGTQEATLFDEPDNTPRTLVEAINETMNSLSEELLLNGNFIYNGQRRNNVLAGSGTTGQPRGQGSPGSSQTGGRIEDGTETSNSSDRAANDKSGGRSERNGGENQGTEKEEPAKGQLTKAEAAEIIADMEEHAEVAPEIELTIENWDALFGEDGRVNTPLGEVKMGENQFTKLMRQGRNGKLGMVKPTLENPDIIIEDESQARDGDNTERPSSYVFVKTFLKGDGSRYYYFTSITVSKEGREVVVSSQEKSRNRILRLMLEGSVIWRTPKDATTSSAEKQGLDYAHPNEAEDATKGSGITPQSTSSAHKDTEKSAVTQTIGEKVAQAEAETEQNPTEAQKEAGNYKKGHITIDGYRITIEQPKGSTRRGTDENGKRWEQKMNNTYGYIRGTQSVDGDHIDIFLSDDPTTGNVYVVDQVKPDGTFDEHKVMYGFNSMEEARQAYLSNYEEGWTGLGNITEVSKDEFKKWIDSSHRKTKPFAEYKSVNKANVANEPNAPEAGFEIAPAQYTTKRGKVLDMFLVKFAEPLTKEQQRAAKELARAERGWYDRNKDGFMMRSEESAQKLANTVMGDEETVNDAQPLSLADMQQGGEPAMRQVDVEGLMQAINRDGEAKLSDHFVMGRPGLTEKATSRQTESTAQEKKPKNSGQFGLVSDERMEELKKRLKQKILGQMNMGVDPEILAIGMELTAGYIDRGIKKFADYAKVMIDSLGDDIRPYLKAFYNGARDLPEVQETGLADEMTPYDEVRTFDTANFDKGQGNAMATAEMVVAEQEANRQADAAKEQLTNQRNEQRRKERQKKQEEPKIADLFSGQEETVAESQENVPFKKGDRVIYNGEPATVYDIEDGKLVLDTGLAPVLYESADPKDVQRANGKQVSPSSKKQAVSTQVKQDIQPTEQKQEDNLSGDSADYQKRAIDEKNFVGEIAGEISYIASQMQYGGAYTPLTMARVKKMLDTYDTLHDLSTTDIQELVELAMTQLTRLASQGPLNSQNASFQRKGYENVVALYNAQPMLNARDSTRVERQQYSTPTPFGYVMGQFVRAGRNVESVLEPSAGNGALTIAFDPAIVHVNDIDDRRLSNLRTLGYGQVTGQNALLPFEGEQVDAMLTNPPFGSTTQKVYDDIFKISSLEGQMAINALDAMKDNGRAAIVIGGNTEYRENGVMKPKDMQFFGYLYSHYNVVDVINMDGEMYARNGTKYPVRIILINGRKTGSFQRVIPPVKSKARAEKITTFDELYNRVQDDILQLQQMGSETAGSNGEATATDRGTREQDSRTNNQSNAGNGNEPLRSGERSRRTQPNRDTSRTEHAGRAGSTNEQSTAARVDNGNRGNARGTDDVPQQPSATRSEQPSGNVADEPRRSGGTERIDTTPQSSANGGRLAVKLTDEKVPYPNRSQAATLMSVVPANQAQVLAASLADIGDVDQFLVDRLGYSSKEELFSYLAAEQIDSVALAINQMSKGNGFIIGDMTGVGKGRQGAALIRYAVRQGKKPIYFTQKPALFADNYRDLCDIGSSDLRPFVIASSKDGVITDAKGNVVYKLPTKKEVRRVFDYIMQNGTLPDEYDYAITTYSQIQNGTKEYEAKGDEITEKDKSYNKGKTPDGDVSGQVRRDVIAALANDNYLILDESHTVGGQGGGAMFMQYLMPKISGVTFLSATFAKRPDNMPLYAMKTALSDSGMKPQEMIEAIAKGGVTLQEIMSKQLVQSGQMIRRERSFQGVNIDWLPVTEEADKVQRAQFDEVADIFNAIRSFQDDYIKPLVTQMSDDLAEQGSYSDLKRGTEAMGVKNTPFASKMYNLVNQLLFALKADAVADRTIWNLKNGFKPVISFTNTMEGFLEEAPKDTPMDEIPNFSLTLLRALDGVMRYQVTDADSNTTGSSFRLSDLSPEGQARYNEIRNRIMNLSANLPISPMDTIKIKIEEAGYTVGEITGRTTELIKDENGKYVVRNRTDKDKKAAARDFNNGKLDVLIINKSGSTGISLHSSTKFADQRQRVMVFAQFQQDISDEVQMRGRIDRTGQIYRGRYEYIVSSIPAEQRLQMMFKAKLKSLDANTTSSQKSKFNEMQVVDYLNKYGDEVTWQYMLEHPELSERLGDPLDMLSENNGEKKPKNRRGGENAKPQDGCAAKIARYLPFLPVAEQERVFKDITEAYQVKIQLLNDAGENDLEITTMPLRAETKKRSLWRRGTAPNSGNAFADNTYLEEVEVDVLKKPMKANEIKAMASRLTDGKDFEQWRAEMHNNISNYYDKKATALQEKLEAKANERAEKQKEKYIKNAKKARQDGKNTMTDEEITQMAQEAAATVISDAREKTAKQVEAIVRRKNDIEEVLDMFTPLQPLVIPLDLREDAIQTTFTPSYGTFVGYKFSKEYSPSTSTAIFATLDGRRKVELPLRSEKVFSGIRMQSTMNSYTLRDINMDSWDSRVPTKSRRTAYIVTGNLLQAVVDTEKDAKTKGYLISYSTIDGDTRQGILLPERFQPNDLRSSVPISSRLHQIRSGEKVESEDGKVSIAEDNGWRRGYGSYILRVPKSKQTGYKYFGDKELRKLVEKNEFETKGNSMVAKVSDKNLPKVLDRLSKLGVTVLQESKLTEVDDNQNDASILQRGGNGALTDDELSYENDPVAKMTGRSPRTAAQRRAFAERERQRMVQRVQELAKKLHLDNVDIVTDASTLQGRRAKAKGFYSRKTGRITIVIPNHTSVFDAEQTLLHEAVAHYGLRKLFGTHFDTFLNNVFNNADEDVRARIVELAKKHNWDFATATEEYLASLAENTNFENINAGWWSKIKDLFIRMLHSIGFENFSGVTLSDNELRYILWRSYENLAEPGRYRSILGEAEDIAKQSELKVGNYAVNNASQNAADDLYRDGDPEVQDRVFARRRYEERVKRGMYQAQEAIQDSMLGLQEAMQAILKGEGKKNVYIEDVPGFENAYLGENRLSSINQAEADAFANILFNPLLKEVSSLAPNKEAREELTDYMMAKHGLERNRVMAERDAQAAYDTYINKHPNSNKTLQDFIDKYRKKDYAGLTALTATDNVSDAELEAQQMVDAYESNHNTDDLWKKTKAVSDAILSKLYDTGMMSKDTYDKIRSMYDYYIPLRGFDQKTSEEVYAYLNSNNSAFNAPIKTARGRKSKADDPFAYLQSMVESAIMQGNRNKLVKQRFLNFALNHPSDLVSISDIWLKHNDITDEWEPVFPDNIESTDTAEEVERKMKDFEEKMSLLAEQDPEMYKHGKDAINIPYRVVNSRELHQHQVIARRNGRDYVITINGNPRAAQALNGQTNPDNNLHGSIGQILDLVGDVNRTLSSVYTTLQPDFIASNFLRDTIFANSMVWIKESPKYAVNYNTNFSKLPIVRMKSLLAKYRKGNLDMNNEIEKMFYEFIINGGETGFLRMADIDKHKEEIEKLLKAANDKIPLRLIRESMATWIGEVGRGIEMRARFAAYVTSRNAGRSIDRSIWDAKEISVNFNKKGSGDRFLGATGQTAVGNAAAAVAGTGRILYIFWNAGIQGMFGNFAKYAKRHPAKMASAAAIWFALGLLIPALASSDGDDDDNYFDNPKHIRRQNLIIKGYGRTWIKIPLPIEYRAIYGMGELAGSTIFNNEKLETSDMLSQLSQLLPIDVMEGKKALYPSSIKPVVDVSNNETWYGTPIWKDTPYNKYMPEWTKAYKSTNKDLIELASVINELSGGNKYRKGAVDLNPAAIEYLLKQYTGGFFTFTNQILNLTDVSKGEKEFDWRYVPLANRMFMTGADERYVGRGLDDKFFDYMDYYKSKSSEFSAIKNDRSLPLEKKAELITEIISDPDYLKMKSANNAFMKLNNAYKMAKEEGNEKAAEELNKQIYTLKHNFVSSIEKDIRK